jgi:hypothetical protein
MFQTESINQLMEVEKKNSETESRTRLLNYRKSKQC